MKKPSTLYFAGPLFSEAEKEFNKKLTERLESELGLGVFLPQRDGYEFAKLATLSQKEKTTKIFELDRNKVFESDIFLFVLDGRVPDEGAALELGLAYAQRWHTDKSKLSLMVGLMTDVRASFIDQQLNPMLAGALEYIAPSENDLFAYLKSHVKGA